MQKAISFVLGSCLLITVAFSQPPSDFSARIKIGSIYFPFNSSDLTDAHFNKINILANEFIRLNSTNRKIVVVGHTDGVGSNEYNLILSSERAHNVASFFETTLNESIGIEWEGENRLADPLNPKDDTNRRVDIFIECGSDYSDGFCSCHPEVHHESIAVSPESEHIVENWIVNMIIETSSISNCQGGIILESRFIDVQSGSVQTRTMLKSNSAGSNENFIAWNGSISNGDEIIFSLLNTDRQCGIGLNYDRYSTLEVEASYIGDKLIPLVTAGASMMDLSTSDKYMFRSSSNSCQYDLSLSIGKISSINKPF